MRFVGFALRGCAVAAACAAAGLLMAGDTPLAQAGGSGNVTMPTMRAAWNATDFTVTLSADSITTLSNCYTDPTIIADGSGSPVTFGASSLTDTSKAFATNALAGKPVAVSGQLISSGFAPAYTLTTVTDTSAGYAVNALAGLTIVAEDVRGGGAGVTYTTTSITDPGKALVPNSLVGLGVLATWGFFDQSVAAVLSNTATTITLSGAWVGNGTPAAGAAYTVSTVSQATGTIVSNTATEITIADVWSPSTPNIHTSYSIAVPAAKITGSGGTVTYTRRDTGSTGAAYGASTLTDPAKTWAADEFAGAVVTSGANSAVVASNTATVLTLGAPWSPATPAASAAYVISGSVQDTSKSFGTNAFNGFSLVGIAPGSSGGGGTVTYGSFAGSGGTVAYGASTLTDTTAAFPIPNGLAGKTVVAGGVSGVVLSNTATVITLTAPWSAQPFNGLPYIIAWMTDTSKSYAANSLVGRTVVSGTAKAVVFANSATNLTLQSTWSPSTPIAGAAYTVTPQTNSGVVSTNTATRLSMSSGWSPFAPPAGGVYYLLLSTVNASIASNTGTAITTTAPWSPAVPLNGSSYSVANSQPISTCGVGSYQTTITYDPAKLQYVSATNGGFITSTGRTLYISPCLPATTSNTVSFNCPTQNATPLGPTGSGTLATVKFHPIVAGPTGSTILQHTTTLADIQGDNISHVDTNGTVLFSRCADVSGNGSVAIQDVIQILGQVGKTTSSPGWDPKYDMTDPLGAITINDVIYALSEVGQFCTFVP